MSKRTEKILDTIRRDRIVPVSRWKFIVRCSALWALIVLGVVLFALSLSLSWYSTQDTGWFAYRSVFTHLHFFSLAFPYFWVTLSAIFVVFAALLFRRTPRAYRFGGAVIAAVMFFLGISIGGVAHLLRADKYVDETFSHNFSAYNHMTTNGRGVWMQPENGFLGGVVVSEESNGEFPLDDFRSNRWRILLDESSYIPFQVATGDQVRIVGKQIGEDAFLAQEIRLWHGRRGMRGGGMMGR